MVDVSADELGNKIVFRAGIRTRIGETLFGGVLAVVSFVGAVTVATLAGVVVCGMLEKHLGAPAGMAVGGGLFAALPAFIIVLRWGGRCALSRLRTAVEISPSGVSVGRCLLRRSFECAEIEHIRLTPEESQAGPWIELCARDRRWRVRLDGAEWDCALELCERCPNAIYVGADGKEHLPASPDRPLRVLDHLVRLRVRTARLLFGAAVLILSMCALSLVVVAVGLVRGRISFESPWAAVQCVFGVGLYLALGYALLFNAKKKREAAEQLTRQVAKAKEQGVCAE